jgi:hypothetical protein
LRRSDYTDHQVETPTADVNEDYVVVEKPSIEEATASERDDDLVEEETPLDLVDFGEEITNQTIEISKSFEHTKSPQIIKDEKEIKEITIIER